MVRIAVISDVHANLTALRAVLADIRGKGVDGYLCAGDLVGYGVHPNECIEVLQNLPLLSVVGNHDLVAVGAATTERCDWLARVTLEWTAERLSTDSRRYLEGLPAVASTGSITMTHGSLSDRFEYIGTPEQARRQLNELRLSQPAAQLLILGHTHRPWAFSERDGNRLRLPGRRIKLQIDQSHVLNPGSVGQSRQRSPDARYMLLDLVKLEASFHAVAYDIRACRADLQRHGLPTEACHRRPPVAARTRRLAGSVRRRLFVH
jgi:predicted phosphodiesterase